jgi:hypothetical protein
MVQHFIQLYILRRFYLLACALAYCHDALLSCGLDLLHKKNPHQYRKFHRYSMRVSLSPLEAEVEMGA